MGNKNEKQINYNEAVLKDEKVVLILKKFDKNGDGQIDREEFSDFLKEICEYYAALLKNQKLEKSQVESINNMKAKILTPEWGNELFTKADKDNSGKISHSEFGWWFIEFNRQFLSDFQKQMSDEFNK